MTQQPLEALVVEDDPDHALRIRRVLERQEHPFGITLVHDGASCLDVLDARPWSVILLDYGIVLPVHVATHLRRGRSFSKSLTLQSKLPIIC